MKLFITKAQELITNNSVSIICTSYKSSNFSYVGSLSLCFNEGNLAEVQENTDVVLLTADSKTSKFEKFDSDVNGFRSYSKILRYLPHFDNKTSGQLKYLSITNSKMAKISPLSLKRLQNLIELDLSSNEIKSLSSFIFSQNRNLKSINLNYNQINFIDSSAFFGLEKQLKNLDLQENLCCNHSVSSKQIFMEEIEKIVIACRDPSKILNSTAEIEKRFDGIETKLTAYGALFFVMNSVIVTMIILMVKIYKNTKNEKIGQIPDKNVRQNETTDYCSIIHENTEPIYFNSEDECANVKAT